MRALVTRSSLTKNRRPSTRKLRCCSRSFPKSIFPTNAHMSSDASRLREWDMSHGRVMSRKCTYEFWCLASAGMRHLAWMSHVTQMHIWVRMPRVWGNESCRVNESCHTYEWIITNRSSTQMHWWVLMPRVWGNESCRMDESCHAYEW